MQEEKILIIGVGTQMGHGLMLALKDKYGKKAVVACDKLEIVKAKVWEVKYIRLDVTNKAHLQLVIVKEKITQIYLLAEMNASSSEQSPLIAWQVTIEGLLNVLELSVRYKVGKVFWPSSTVSSIPTTVYEISKLSGEYWCRYYFEKFGLDVRSVRYPPVLPAIALDDAVRDVLELMDAPPEKDFGFF